MATGRIARPAIPFDLPALRVDTSAVRFAERTRAMMERMGSLAPSPYRYGSELALAQFPRFNDLGLFARVRHRQHGHAKSRRRAASPRLRIENLYRGIGFVGVISGHDHDVGSG